MARAVQINRQNLTPLRHGRVDRARGHDPSSGHKDRDGSKACRHFSDGTIDRLFITDVNAPTTTLCALCSGGGYRVVSRQAVKNGDAGACRSQRHGHRATDTAGTTTHNGDMPLQRDIS